MSQGHKVRSSFWGLMMYRHAPTIAYELRTKFRLGGPIVDYIGFWGDLFRDKLQL